MSILHSKIKHLTMAQVDELMARYYSGENVNELIDYYQIDERASRLYTLFPSIIKEEKCATCDVNLTIVRPSKSSFRYTKDVASCPMCNHSNTTDCRCNNCIAVKETAKKVREEEQRNKIREVYNLGRQLHCEPYLDVEDALYLSSIIRGHMDESFNYIKAVSGYETGLSPTADFTYYMIKHLTSRGILRVHPNSPLSAFVQDEKFPNTYYTAYVNYAVNFDRETELLSNPPSTDFIIFAEETFELWRKIAIEECKQFLAYNLKKVGFEYKIQEKSTAVFSSLLVDYSVAQIYAIIYRSVSNATRQFQEKKLNRVHAANLAVSSIQRYGEKALAMNWEIAGFRRNYDLPQTIVSEVLFDRILKIGTNGFEMPPSLHLIKQLREQMFGIYDFEIDTDEEESAVEVDNENDTDDEADR